MINQIKVSLPQNEFSALINLALDELRDPSSEVHHIVKQELIRRGLLPPEETRQPVVEPSPGVRQS